MLITATRGERTPGCRIDKRRNHRDSGESLGISFARRSSQKYQKPLARPLTGGEGRTKTHPQRVAARPTASLNFDTTADFTVQSIFKNQFEPLVNCCYSQMHACARNITNLELLLRLHGQEGAHRSKSTDMMTWYERSSSSRLASRRAWTEIGGMHRHIVFEGGTDVMEKHPVGIGQSYFALGRS